MTRLTLVTAVLASIGLLLISVAPAAAQFKADNKSTEGNANFQLSIENAGSPVFCGETETNQLAWQIKKEGKAAESGPTLALKFKSWGTCIVEYKEGEAIKEAALSGGECAWEASETGSEAEVTDKIASACKLKGEVGGKTCEVTLEPKSNEKLSNLTLIDSGENDEDMAVNIAMQGVTVGASGAGCEIAGIKSTSAAELTGAIEALEITAEVAVPRFRLLFGATGNAMRAVGQERTAAVFNTGSAEGAPGFEPGNGLFAAGNSPWFTIFKESLGICQATPLRVNGRCLMQVKFKMKAVRIVNLRLQIWEGGQIRSEVVFLAIS